VRRFSILKGRSRSPRDAPGAVRGQHRKWTVICRFRDAPQASPSDKTCVGLLNLCFASAALFDAENVPRFISTSVQVSVELGHAPPVASPVPPVGAAQSHVARAWKRGHGNFRESFFWTPSLRRTLKGTPLLQLRYHRRDHAPRAAGLPSSHRDQLCTVAAFDPTAAIAHPKNLDPATTHVHLADAPLTHRGDGVDKEGEVSSFSEEGAVVVTAHPDTRQDRRPAALSHPHRRRRRSRGLRLPTLRPGAPDAPRPTSTPKLTIPSSVSSPMTSTRSSTPGAAPVTAIPLAPLAALT